MYNRLQYYSVYLRVFFVILCEIAIAQSYTEKPKATQRLNEIDDDPYHYWFSIH
jgi:hypothetical protein